MPVFSSTAVADEKAHLVRYTQAYGRKHTVFPMYHGGSAFLSGEEQTSRRKGKEASDKSRDKLHQLKAFSGTRSAGERPHDISPQEQAADQQTIMGIISDRSFHSILVVTSSSYGRRQGALNNNLV